MKYLIFLICCFYLGFSNGLGSDGILLRYYGPTDRSPPNIYLVNKKESFERLGLSLDEATRLNEVLIFNYAFVIRDNKLWQAIISAVKPFTREDLEEPTESSTQLIIARNGTVETYYLNSDHYSAFLLDIFRNIRDVDTVVSKEIQISLLAYSMQFFGIQSVIKITIK